MILDTIRYSGVSAGPSVLVLGGIHGDETAGTEAIARFVRQLDTGSCVLLRGSITLVPVANPSARATMTRQTDANLNRMIYDDPPVGYAETPYAREVAGLIREHDILLDLHSFSAAGSPFVFLDSEDDRDIALSLGCEHIVTGWPALYPDDGGGDTCAYARACGRRGLTLECGQHRAPEAPDA